MQTGQVCISQSQTTVFVELDEMRFTAPLLYSRPHQVGWYWSSVLLVWPADHWFRNRLLHTHTHWLPCFQDTHNETDQRPKMNVDDGPLAGRDLWIPCFGRSWERWAGIVTGRSGLSWKYFYTKTSDTSRQVLFHEGILRLFSAHRNLVSKHAIYIVFYLSIAAALNKSHFWTNMNFGSFWEMRFPYATITFNQHILECPS